MIALTVRQRQIVRMVADGRTNREIAVRLRIGETTVETHLRFARSAYGASNRAHVVALAFRAGDLT